MTELAKKTMLEAFKQKKSPTMFLSSFFRTTERDIVRSKKVVIDIKRNEEAVAVDVVRNTKGFLNKNKRFTTKEYTPPLYDEYTSYNADELLDRMPGMNEYDNVEYSAQFTAMVTDDQVENQEKILRAIEKMASDTFFTGQINLINNESLDFKAKGTHFFNAAAAWSVAGSKPWDDIEKACNLIRKDAKRTAGIAIFSEESWREYVNLATVANRGDQMNITLDQITNPVANTDGAVFHGYIIAGSYKLQAWTYPQFYEVPVGFGLPNEGTLVPFVPAEKVLVLPMADQIDLRLVYAGIPTLVPSDSRLQSLGLDSMPVNVRGDFMPYASVDAEGNSIIAGIKSAPLTIPTQIDGWCVIST